jgi:uncharacterized membrane protein (UPF0127 family)
MLRSVCLIALVSLTGCGPSEGRLEARDASSAQYPSAESRSKPAPDQERLPPPGEAWVIFGTDTVQAELARSYEEREKGLMFRESLAKGRGMLFVFPDAQTRSFWMKDTFLPLDIAYLDAELRIVDIQAMEPESLESHPSALPAMFALEVPLGWFSEVGIAVGDGARVVFGPG